VVLLKYATLAGPAPARTALTELLAAGAAELTVAEVANLQAEARKLQLLQQQLPQPSLSSSSSSSSSTSSSSSQSSTS
jgi:hypothetical protein